MTATHEIDIEIRERFLASDSGMKYWLAIVTTKSGRCYSATWAGAKPTIEMVYKAWVDDRKSFDPFFRL
jgi:hypothetical protein